MRYFKVVAKGGHVGTGRYEPLSFAFAAESILDAMDKARAMPGVKHSDSSAILSAREVTFDEFTKLRRISAYERRRP